MGRRGLDQPVADIQAGDASAAPAPGGGDAGRCGDKLSGGSAGPRWATQPEPTLDVCCTEVVNIDGCGRDGLARTMSDHQGLPLYSHACVGGPARGAEATSWGSTEALDAVKRICERVTARCHQAIATHRPADAPDEQIGAAT